MLIPGIPAIPQNCRCPECPENAVKVPFHGCVCRLGYYKDDETKACVKCLDGYNCPGDGSSNVGLCPAGFSCTSIG